MSLHISDQDISAVSEYAVTSKTRTRFDTLFTENDTSSAVRYSELGGNRASVEINDFEQSSTALADALGAELTGAINKLVFEIGEREYLVKILNIEEVWDAWRGRKGVLLGKYQEIPDLINLLDDYAECLKESRTLLPAIRHQGIYGMLFPQIKHLAFGQIPAGYARHKILRDFMMSVNLPVTEQITLRQTGEEITIDITSALNKAEFEYQKFMDLSRRMFGKQVTETDINFQSVEKYTLDRFSLKYTSGVRHSYFEIKGKYFKDDRLTFKLKS